MEDGTDRDVLEEDVLRGRLEYSLKFRGGEGAVPKEGYRGDIRCRGFQPPKLSCR